MFVLYRLERTLITSTFVNLVYDINLDFAENIKWNKMMKSKFDRPGADDYDDVNDMM